MKSSVIESLMEFIDEELKLIRNKETKSLEQSALFKGGEIAYKKVREKLTEITDEQIEQAVKEAREYNRMLTERESHESMTWRSEVGRESGLKDFLRNNTLEDVNRFRRKYDMKEYDDFEEMRKDTKILMEQSDSLTDSDVDILHKHFPKKFWFDESGDSDK